MDKENIIEEIHEIAQTIDACVARLHSLRKKIIKFEHELED